MAVSPISYGAHSCRSLLLAGMILGSSCIGKKVSKDLMLDPTITPLAMHVCYGRRRTCLDRTSDLIVPLPENLEGP